MDHRALLLDFAASLMPGLAAKSINVLFSYVKPAIKVHIWYIASIQAVLFFLKKIVSCVVPDIFSHARRILTHWFKREHTRSFQCCSRYVSVFSLHFMWIIMADHREITWNLYECLSFQDTEFIERNLDTLLDLMISSLPCQFPSKRYRLECLHHLIVYILKVGSEKNMLYLLGRCGYCPSDCNRNPLFSTSAGFI